MASTQLRHSVNTMNCIAPGLYSNTAPESEICRPSESILPPLNCSIPTSLHSALWSDPDQVARSLIETDSMTNIKPWYASLAAHQRDNLSENLSHDGNGVFYPSETSSGFDESSPNELITKGPFSKHYGFNGERIDSTNITTDPSLSSPLRAGHRMQTSSDSEGHKLLNSSSSPGGSSAQNHTDCDHRDGPTEVGRRFEQNSLLGDDSYANSGRMLYVNNLFCAKALFCEARSMTTQSTCYSTVGDERSVQFRQWGEHQYGRNDHHGDQAITPEPDFKPVTDECGASMEAPDYQPPFPRRVPPMGLHSANQTFTSSNLPHNPFSSPPVSRSVTAPQIAAAAAAAAVAAAAAASAATSLSSRPMPSVPQPADGYPPLFGQNFSHKPPSAPRIGPYDSKSFPQQAPAYPFSGTHPFVPAQSGPHLHQPPYPPYAGLRHFPSTGYPHGVQNSFGYGLDGTRRKNATRESTTTLKVWLQEHIKNPYPTKGEKIMLAIITKMTLTQVSTWFANARRRLKKENKMSWPPKSNNASTSGQTSPDNRNSTAPGENLAKPPRSEESCVKEREKRNSPQINEAEDSATDDEDASATDGEVEDSYMNENTLSVDKNLSDFSACNGPYYMNVPGRLRPGSDLAAGEGTEAQEPNSRPTFTGPGQIFRGNSPAAGNTLANGMRPCPNPLLTDPERLQSAEEYSGSFQNLRGFSRMYPKPVSFHPASSGRSRSPTVGRPENPLNSPISFEKIGRFPDRPPLEIDSGSLSLFNPYVPAARNSYTMPYINTVPEVFPTNDVIPQIPVPETALSRITTDLQPEKISYEQRIPFNFETHENSSR